jgi:hypothetical protein
MKGMQSSIAARVKALGWVEIDLKTLDEIFPHPARMSRQEMDDMITLALVGNIPPPKIADSQEQQLDDWCGEHGFRRERIPERRVLRVSVNAALSGGDRERQSATSNEIES